MPKTVKGEFERYYGEGTWERFKTDILNEVKPKVVRERYKTADGRPMWSRSYYIWKRYVEELSASSN